MVWVEHAPCSSKLLMTKINMEHHHRTCWGSLTLWAWSLPYSARDQSGNSQDKTGLCSSSFILAHRTIWRPIHNLSEDTSNSKKAQQCEKSHRKIMMFREMGSDVRIHNIYNSMRKGRFRLFLLSTFESASPFFMFGLHNLWGSNSSPTTC